VTNFTHNFTLKSYIKSVPVVFQLITLPQQRTTVKEKTQQFHFIIKARKMFVQNAYISKLWILYNVTFNPEIGKKKIYYYH